MRKTEAPRSFWKVGNVIPITKLKNQDDKLPIDIATGRGPTSNNSAQLNIELVKNLLQLINNFTNHCQQRTVLDRVRFGKREYIPRERRHIKRAILRHFPVKKEYLAKMNKKS